MNLMKPEAECNLYEDVLPWLLAKRDMFIKEQSDAVQVSDEALNKGIVASKEAHADFLKKRQERLTQEAQDKINEKNETIKRRAERA
jgi:hypothetical protein